MCASPVRGGRALSPLLIFVLLLTGCGARQPQTVRVSPDLRGFTLSPSGRPFTPWGLNYGHHGQLIEDFWATDWSLLDHDFTAIEAVGANVVRVHLQFGKFMVGPEQPNRYALQRLRRLLAIAAAHHVYLDLTGLGCYRVTDVPPWYDALDEKARWAAQARFWKAIAKVCRDSSVVFCYDLMNEPFTPGDARTSWYSGAPFGGLDFIQFISKDPGGRRREDVAKAWVGAMTGAIRQEDPKHLITVGMLPWDVKWHFLSGFVPEELAPDLDFISVHIYPAAGKIGQSMGGLKRFAVGKPVVIEETFPLYCGIDDERKFLIQSKQFASGWIGHFDGDSIDELRQLKKQGKINAGQSLYLAWAEMMEELKGKMWRD